MASPGRQEIETKLQEMKFDLVLHGHKHNPAYRETSFRSSGRSNPGRRLHICGAGSTSVDKSELPEGMGNHMAILRFRSLGRHQDQPFFEVQWKELRTDAQAIVDGWQKQASWVIQG